MSRAWIKNGRLMLDKSGRVLLCDTCPCTDSGSVVSPCCATPIPRNLFVTIMLQSMIFGTCTGLDGTVFPITYNDATALWEGSFTAFGQTFNCTFGYNGSVCTFGGSSASCSIAAGSGWSSTQCSPFAWVTSNVFGVSDWTVGGAGCGCGARVIFVITE